MTDRIAGFNDIKDASWIFPGQKLEIPMSSNEQARFNDNHTDTATTEDSAMTTSPKYGGIDLDSKLLEIEEKGEGVELDIPYDFLLPANMPVNINGFIPGILRIIPKDLPLQDQCRRR